MFELAKVLTRKYLSGCILSLVLAPVLGQAHHSFAAEYTRDESATIEGVVEEVWFRNPHVRYYVAVINEDGEKEIWNATGGSTSNLIRSGWTKDTIKVGDRVKMTGYLGREDKKLMSITTIVLPDGTQLPRR